jgi:hypothetical protein
MPKITAPSVKTALVARGIEVYRVVGDIVEVAERVRLHLMDSGIRVLSGANPQVRFTARTQRSENQALSPAAQFDRVRAAIGALAAAHGWTEIEAASKDILDPVDHAKVLDVFYEVTYARDVAVVDDVTAAVQWALTVEKYVSG